MNYLHFFQKKSTQIKILAGPFRGATLILNPSDSKRKIFGLYEGVLNPWLEKVLPKVQLLFDIGANDGYFTYGSAHVFNKNWGTGQVIAFEPNLVNQPNLITPSKWKEYQKINFEFVPLFVGNENSSTVTTLDKFYEKHPHLHQLASLVKVDVEGAEVSVLQESSLLLKSPHHWVVEIHGDHLLDPVLSIFSEANREVDVHNLAPHWLFGEEKRIIRTRWVTTRF